MFEAIRNFFKSPTFTDDEKKTRVANYINVIVLSNIPILVLFIFTRIFTGSEPFDAANIILFTIIAVLVVVWFLMRSGRVRGAGYLHVSTIWIASTMIALNGSGIRGTAFISYFVVMLMAGLLLGWRPALAFTVISIFAAFGLASAENVGVIDYTQGSPLSVTIEGTVLFSFGAIFLYLIISSLETAVIKANENSDELRKSNQELKHLRDDLENRVQERTAEADNRNRQLDEANYQLQRRTAQFESLVQVSQSISAIRDLQELLPRVVNVISDNYGFYHVGVFLLDSTNEYAVLTAANSDGGQKMLQNKHQLKVGEQGIVGSVTGTGEARIALDVGADAVYFNNPYLSETHSELALPLHSGGRVIGALDVQSKESGAFSDEDIQTLSLLADQVSLAIENARLFESVQRALLEQQHISRQSIRESWKQIPAQQNLVGYRYNALGSSPLKRPVKIVSNEDERDNKPGTVSIPIELRGEIIGSLIVQSPGGEIWDEDERDLIKAVAERVALSAENARLFEETTLRAERERLVSDITGKIRSHNDPQSMLQVALNELKEALGASRVEIVHQSALSGKERKPK